MGRELPNFEGVKPASKTSIEIDFRYNGTRCREKVKLKPTATNLKRAHQHRCAILAAIESGTFDYKSTFPDSKNAIKFAKKLGDIQTVEQYLSSWLSNKKQEVSSSTYDGYRKIINNKLIPEFGDFNLSDLKRVHVKQWARKLTVSNKYISNILSPLRTALSEAVEDEIIEYNILAEWTYSRKEEVKEDDDVDPFTVIEMQLILGEMQGQVRNVFQFSFWTGLRPSETVALRWDDIDFVNGSVRVSKALTEAAQKVETTKTKAGKRDVKLLPAALDALKKQKQYTFLQDEEIFHNPNTDKAWTGHQVIGNHWKRAIRKSGVRYRRQYQTRHTYASMMLSAGEHPMWVAKQMGHKDWTMIARVYGKWIPDANPDAGNRAVEIFGTEFNESKSVIRG